MKFHFGFLSMGDNGAIPFNLTAAVSTAGLGRAGVGRTDDDGPQEQGLTKALALAGPRAVSHNRAQVHTPWTGHREATLHAPI